MSNYQEIIEKLTEIELEIIYIYYIAKKCVYSETIARILQKKQKDIDVAIHNLAKMGLIEERKENN